ARDARPDRGTRLQAGRLRRHPADAVSLAPRSVALRAAVSLIIAACGRTSIWAPAPREPVPNPCAGAGTDGAEEVQVPSGAFLMGCVESSVDPECALAPFGDEWPAHTVTLSAFAIDRTEVTQRAYDRCVAAGCCDAPIDNYENYAPATSPDFPVVHVTTQHASAHCDCV